MTMQDGRDIEQPADLPDFEPRTGPLAAPNQGFHNAYDQLVSETLVTLGTTLPFISVIDDFMSLFADGSEMTVRVIPPRYHQLKSLCHLVFRVQLTLMANREEQLHEDTITRLNVILAEIDVAAIALQKMTPADADASQSLLQHSRELIANVIHSKSATHDNLRHYAKQTCGFVMANAYRAVRAELDIMHASVMKWQAEMGPTKWSNLYVVVCGNHQPRYRAAALQYFERILGEQEGVAAEKEDHLIFGESVRDIAGVRDLLARHIVDQRAAQIYFDDPRRLQKDLLADVATEYLNELLSTE